MSIRVLVAEDSYLVREAITALLAEADDIELVGVCSDLDSMLASADGADVVVTDIRMPPSGTDEGIRAAARLRDTHPGVGVVVLSQYLEPEYVLALLESGSDGRSYLLKDRISDGDQLINAIRVVASGGSVIDPKVVEVLIAARTRSPRSPLSRLSPRETEILAAMAEGLTNAAIAQSLVVSERAVEKHINSIFSKLDLAEARDANRRVKAVLMHLQGG